MTFEELKDKANSLPLVPGVYIMRDKTDKVIYVGKAKKLKNRVSQYFQDTASPTRISPSPVGSTQVLTFPSTIICACLTQEMREIPVLPLSFVLTSSPLPPLS